MEHARLQGLACLRVPLRNGKLHYHGTPGVVCIVRGTSVSGNNGPKGRVAVGYVADDAEMIETGDDSHYRSTGFLIGSAYWAAFYIPLTLPSTSRPMISGGQLLISSRGQPGPGLAATHVLATFASRKQRTVSVKEAATIVLQRAARELLAGRRSRQLAARLAASKAEERLTALRQVGIGGSR